MDLLSPLQSYGLLGILLTISLTANAFLYFKIVDVFQKRLDDEVRRGDVFIGTAKDLLNNNANMQKSLDTILSQIYQK